MSTHSSTSTNISPDFRGGDLLGRSPSAAQLRSENIRNRADRPSDRRSAPEPGAIKAHVVRAPIQIVHQRAADGATDSALTFTGCASVVETGYKMYDMFGEYTETVSASAFDNTLRTPDLDVPLVIDHDPGRRLARTLIAPDEYGHLELSATEQGLMCSAALDPNDPDVAYIAPKLRSGLIDEMSFRFRIIAGQWSPDFTEYRINEVDIHRGDVSIVAYGANPATTGGLRGAGGGAGGSAVVVHTGTGVDEAVLRKMIREAIRSNYVGGDLLVGKRFKVSDADLL